MITLPISEAERIAYESSCPRLVDRRKEWHAKDGPRKVRERWDREEVERYKYIKVETRGG